MQKDNSETSKLRKVKRIANASTLESLKKNIADTTQTSIHPGTSYNRVTMAPFEFDQPHNLPRRKIGNDRASIMPSFGPLDASRIDTDCNDMELLYNEYLQKIMTEIIIKKKGEERKNLILTQLATITKERDYDEEKLFKLRTRERDIVHLTDAQNQIDAQIEALQKCTNKEEMKTVSDILSQLQSLLEPFDILRCENIILPKSPSEWKETEQILKTCITTLQSIMELIKTKSDSYQAINAGIRDFLNTYKDIEDQQKKLEQAVSNLQVLILKTASLSLAREQD